MDAPHFHCDLCRVLIPIKRDEHSKEWKISGCGLKEDYEDGNCGALFAATQDAVKAKAADHHLCNHCLVRLWTLLNSTPECVKLGLMSPPKVPALEGETAQT